MNLPIALLALGLVTPQDAAPDAASGAQAASDARGTLGEGVPEGFIVRPGYHVTLAAGDLEEARFIEFGEEGVLYVSMPQTGKIQALKDEDGDGVYESRTDFVTDQSNCHSMDFANGWLYYTSSQQGYCRRARDTDAGELGARRQQRQHRDESQALGRQVRPTWHAWHRRDR